jgi:hypothetical protein
VASTTRAPQAAKARADSSPIPPAAPVISTTRSRKTDGPNTRQAAAGSWVDTASVLVLIEPHLRERTSLTATYELIRIN